MQYADYTLWQQAVLGQESDPQSAIARQLAFWRETLADLPEAIALPPDLPRPAVASYRGGRVPLRLDADLHGGLLALARGSGTSLFMVLQAGLAALLKRLAPATTSQSAARWRGVATMRSTTWSGSSSTRWCCAPTPRATRASAICLARVRAGNLAAYGHQDLPFERLVEVSTRRGRLSHHPLFQVMLAFQNDARVDLELPGLRTAFEEVPVASAKFDLSFALAEERAGRYAGRPCGRAGISADLFDEATVEALAQRLERLLAAATEDPDRAIGSLDILSADERRTILTTWNDTARAIPDATIPELFAEQARRTPHARAVVFDDADAELSRARPRANQLAHHLRALGVGPETVVALCVERSLDMVIALLGILKAGGAYVPLDPDYPPERLARMIERARPTRAAHAQLAPRTVRGRHRGCIALDQLDAPDQPTRPLPSN